jgi:hypothetical protein
VNRFIAIVLSLIVVGTACSGGDGSLPEEPSRSSLSEEAKLWCQRNQDLHGQVGMELGEAGQPGVGSEPFSPDDFEFRSFEFYWTGEAGWDRACTEAYERLGESG